MHSRLTDRISQFTAGESAYFPLSLRANQNAEIYGFESASFDVSRNRRVLHSIRHCLSLSYCLRGPVTLTCALVTLIKRKQENLPSQIGFDAFKPDRDTAPFRLFLKFFEYICPALTC